MPNRVTRMDRFSCPKIKAAADVKIELARLTNGQGAAVAEKKSLKGCSGAKVCGVAQQVSAKRVVFDWSDCEYKKQMA